MTASVLGEQVVIFSLQKTERFHKVLNQTLSLLQTSELLYVVTSSPCRPDGAVPKDAFLSPSLPCTGHPDTITEGRYSIQLE